MSRDEQERKAKEDGELTKWYLKWLSTEGAADLTEWELNFVIDIQKKYTNGDMLTPGQFLKLKEVYERHA